MMCIIYDIYYIQYIVYAHICTVQCECILQSLYAQHSASAHPMPPNVHLVYTVQCACTPTQTQSQLPQMELVQGKKKY